MQDCKVNIFGTEYKITLKELKDSDVDGFTDYTEKAIVIRSDNYNEVGNFEWLQKKPLRHELIHAFMAESGLQANWEHVQKFGHDETTVDWITIQSPKMFKIFQELDIL